SNKDSADEVRSTVTVNLTTLGKGQIEIATLLGSAAISATGDALNNILTGNKAANTLNAVAGDDKLYGMDGNDILTDTLGNNTLDGGNGNDRLTGGAGKDSLIGGAGNDTLAGGAGNDLLDGGTGNDVLTDSAGNDTLNGGDGNDTLTAGAGNDVIDGGTGNDAMNGGTGSDTYIVDSAADKIIDSGTTDLNDRVVASISIDLTKLGAGLIEHVTLVGTQALSAVGNARNNTLVGNAGANLLIGDLGNDTLDGGLGADTLRGGKGNDVYVIDNLSDVVDEQGNVDVADKVRTSIFVDLATFAAGAIEQIELTGAGALDASGSAKDNTLSGNSAANKLDGREGNDTIAGNGGNDTLIGGSGNDTLDGGSGNDTLIGGAGNDILRGSSGNDIYVLDDANDTISEATNKDTGDEIQAAFSINLASYDGGSIENATLLGIGAINATGAAAGNKLVGNSAGNILDAGAGNDYLDGGGGNDTLLGGSGNDTYVIDSLADVINEQGNTDVGDEVRTGAFSIDLTTIAGGALENATLLGGASLDITGTTLSNKLTGNSAANVLDGGGGNDVLDGGAGIDTLRGGSGNDVYVVDAGDIVDEQGADSGDELRTAAFSIDLASFASGKIENGTLLGTADLEITGNAATNILTGNSGKNILDGGLGADTLRGGGGNDVYIIDSFGDIVDEQGNTDTGDEVRSDAMSLDLFTLGNGAIENATLFGVVNLSAYGNALHNVLSGNSGSNVLFGGAGDDVLIGGAGNDELDGSDGDDAMKGGAGNDTYYVDSLQDTIDEQGNTDSADLVRASVDVDLSVLGSGAIENASTIIGVGTTIALKGNDSDNVLTGNSYANVLDGGKGDDTLVGSGGGDTFLGGEGDDQIVVLSVPDDLSTLTIDGGAGTDTLKLSTVTTFDFTLVSQTAIQNIETIDLTGSGASKIIVSAQDVADLSSTSSSLFVLGNAGDSVTFTDNATYSGVTNVGGVDYKAYAYGSSTVYLDGVVGVSTNAASDLFLAKIDDSTGFRVDGVKAGSMFGSMSAGIGDVNQDGFEDALFVGSITAFLLYGQAGIYDGPMSSKDPVGASIAELGVNSGVSTTVSGSGDFNGDGIEDFAIGDWGASFAATDSGGAYIVYGKASGPSDQVSLWTLDSSDAAIFSGASFGQGASGYRGIASAGDMNGDGYDDQLMSAYTSGQGIVYVAFGRSDQPSVISSATLNGNDGFAFTGASPQNFVGRTIAGESDFNGDGYADTVISSTTAATIVFGHPGAFDTDLRTNELTGSNGFTITGGNFTVGPGGDFNGDGYDDIVVADKAATAGAFTGTGYVYVIFGEQSGFSSTLDVSQLNGANGFRLFGETNQNAGTSVTLAGDYNGDGYDDLLIGAPGPFFNQGSAFVVYGHSGPSAAAIQLGALNGQDGMEIHGATSSSSAGDSVAAADLNGDGLDEIIIGADHETNAVTTGGAAYVLYGQNFTGNTIVGTSAGETINGGNWADSVAAGQGNDIVNGAGGADAINGGQGNDEIHVADNKFFRIDGGTGVDTLHLDYAGAVDFGNLDGNASTSDRGRIENVEVVDVDNGQANALTLHLADVLDIDATISNVGGVADLDNVLRIDGNAGDTLHMFNADGWGDADTSSLAGYAIYSYQAVKVAVDTDIAVSFT
ncbi:MAG TPA: hypothetical protein VGF43_16035, partial [Dongiaceae bacterium]